LVLARNGPRRRRARRLIEAPPRPVFDADIARLLIRTLARGKHEVLRLAPSRWRARASC
jgi:hypothetical protein